MRAVVIAVMALVFVIVSVVDSRAAEAPPADRAYDTWMTGYVCTVLGRPSTEDCLSESR